MFRRAVRSFIRIFINAGAGGIALAGFIPLLILFAVVIRHIPHVVTSAVAAPPSVSSSIPKITLHWNLQIAKLEDASFSPDGNYMGLALKDGTIRCVNSEGQVKWTSIIPDTNRVLMGPGGSYCAAYTLLNPTKSKVYFLDNSGQIFWDHKVKGAPWTVAVSQRNSQFAVGTGDGLIYVYALGEKKRRFARWKPGGVPTSMLFMPASSKLLVGTWQESSVGEYTVDGDSDWVKDGESDKLYFVQSDNAAESLLLLGVPNRRVPYAVMTLMDKTGATFWRRELEGEEVKAVLSPSGQCVAVGFLSYLEHKGKRIPERHVALYDNRAKPMWDKGGMFFKPRLIGMPTSNSVLVCDEKFLYVMDEKGKVTTKEELPSTPKSWWVDRNSNRLLIWCTNGKLYYYTVK